MTNPILNWSLPSSFPGDPYVQGASEQKPNSIQAEGPPHRMLGTNSTSMGALPVPSMMSAGWSTSYEQGSLGIGTGSISDRAGRDSWLELRDCPFSRESSSFDMESSPSVGGRKRPQS